VNAIATATNFTTSAMGTSVITIQSSVAATPVITPATGSFSSAQTVSITDSTAGAKIFYTLDGSTPTTSSTAYTGTFTVSATTTVQAIATATNFTTSATASSVITIQSGGTTTSGTTSSGNTVVPAPSTDPSAPKIFNFSSSARPGDVISVQGVNFDSTTQAWLAGATLSSATQLTIVNQVGQTWVAAQLPSSRSGALVLWISNSHGASSAVALNQAVPTHLDALQLVPGGAFRVIGRNLMVSGFTPSVALDGLPATLNLAASNENILVATAPASLNPTPASVIMVDNGNGTGAVQLDRTISVVVGSGDPLGLGVGWGAGFTFAGNVIQVNTPCNGTQDDTGAIQAGISSASARGGGVVQLPAGNCLVTSTLTMASKVVLKGAGKDVTFLNYGVNIPILSVGNDLVGISDFTIVNSGAATQGTQWQQNTRSFILRVKFETGTSYQLFFTNNVNMVVSQTDFIQGASFHQNGPYIFGASSGLVFSNNTSTTIDGAPTFDKTHDSLYINNQFTRNAVNQNENPVIVTHGFTMNFAYRIAVIGNTFNVINGPITNKNRNDGEALLTEGGGAVRTENSGTVASATSTTISDPSNTLNVDPFGTGTIPEDYGVAIVSGTGAGQARELVAYSNNTMTVDHPWGVIPDTTSHYATFVWGLEKSLLTGNALTDNPRGIWLYQTAIREVDVVGNTMTNGGGIFLRTFGNQSVKQFDPIYNVRIRNNTASNSTGLWMSYVTVVFANQDATNFGTADIGIEVRGDSLTANVPNVTSTTEDYAGQEGYMNLMRISATSAGQLGTTPMLLGTIFQNDQCINCSLPFVIGTGAYGTTLINNQPPSSTPNFLSNWQTIGPNISGALDTAIQ
jgi:hypothetical protein